MTSTAPTAPPVPFLEGPSVYTGTLVDIVVRRTHRNDVFYAFKLDDGVAPVGVGYGLGDVLGPVHTSAICDIYGLIYPRNVPDLRRLFALFPYDHKETVDAVRALIGHTFTVNAVLRTAKISERTFTTYSWLRAAHEEVAGLPSKGLPI